MLGHDHPQTLSVSDLFFHTLSHTAPMLPVLFVLYWLLEYASHKRGFDLLAYSKISGKLGPLAGTLLGIVPQCGMSVFVTSLYVSRKVTIGTLIATYIATSDEAIPVLLAQDWRLDAVGPLIGVKILGGVAAGYVIDAIVKDKYFGGAVKQAASHHVAEIITELNVTPHIEIVKHAARRTARIFGWVFLVSYVLTGFVTALDISEHLSYLNLPVLAQIVGVGAFGLIPNCVSSITIAQAYLQGLILFPAAIAGLSASAGFGPLVLLRDGDARSSVKLFLITYATSVVLGLLVWFIWRFV